MDASFTRRELLQRATLAGAMLSLPQSLFAAERKSLYIPPLIDVGRGRPVRLDLRTAQAQFEQGKLVEVWGVNGQYLAPTVRVRTQDFVKLTYVNNLTQAISMNIQGLLAPTEMVGSMHRTLEPKSSWSPIVTINQPACTCWYHADTMFNSSLPLYRGLAGLWIIEDKASKEAKLPNQYGVNDIPLILQDHQFNKQGVQVLDMNQAQFFGKTLLVNGRPATYFNANRGWIRLRILNASLSRPYELRLDSGQPLHQIATGMGMFAEPIARPMIRLAPSERVEVLVDLSQGETVSLISGETRGVLDRARRLFSDDKELDDNVILELRPEGMAAVVNEKPQLPPFELSEFEMKIAKERHFQFRPLDRLINQKQFDPKRIDVEAKKGTVERWYLTSTEAIGFTLQGAKFLVETRNRQKLAVKEYAWKDTLWLEPNQETTILVKFEHTASAELPFSFGVADFMLRDRGAMGQMTVSE